MITDLTITGKPAQFGRGVILDVADKIIGQFAACLARKLGPAEEEAVLVAVSATAASEATSDIPTAPARGARRAAAPAAGSEAISDSVLERVDERRGGAGHLRGRGARHGHGPCCWRRARRSPRGGDLGGGGARSHRRGSRPGHDDAGLHGPLHGDRRRHGAQCPCAQRP